MTTGVFGVCGAIVGVFFSVIYGFAFLATGGMPTPSGAVISPITASVAYIVSCGIGGIVVGVLRTLLQTPLGSAIAGIAGMLPVMLGGAVLYYEASIGDFSWWIIVFGSVAVGGPIGLAIRREYASFRQPAGK